MDSSSSNPSGPPQAFEVSAVVAEIQNRRISNDATHVPDWLVDSHLRSVLGHASASGSHAKRIGEGTFVAVGLLGGVALTMLGGFLAHPAAFAMPIWKLKRLLYFDREWRPHLLAIFERLEGDERLVFEAVHHLSTQIIVSNYDALESREFENAYSFEAPNIEQVRSQAGELRPGEVDAILIRLVTRRILTTDGTRFWITF